MTFSTRPIKEQIRISVFKIFFLIYTGIYSLGVGFYRILQFFHFLEVYEKVVDVSIAQKVPGLRVFHV
jgi:hypothetical protein